jgi:hypothetical protein
VSLKRHSAAIIPTTMAASTFSTKSEPVTSCTIGVEANSARSQKAAAGHTHRRRAK